ncbi:MAG: TetR/AcrR family transcriptional regulator, partial [Acidimicrobiales bacterium]
MTPAPTPATPRLPAAERRQQLLDVALEAFASQGFHLTSMNELAEQAGVTKPVLYQHFGSKRELYLEVLRAVGGRMVTDVGKAIADAEGPRQQVEAGFLAYFTWVARERHGFQVLFAGDTRRDPEFLRELGRVETGFATAISDLIAVEGMSSDHRLLLAYGIVGIAETTCRHWIHADVQLTSPLGRPVTGTVQVLDATGVSALTYTWLATSCTPIQDALDLI